jgi:hypothetical protein
MKYERTTYYKDAAFWWSIRWHRWWKGISFNTKRGTTLRLFLWGVDYRTYNTKSPRLYYGWRFPPQRQCDLAGDGD